MFFAFVLWVVVYGFVVGFNVVLLFMLDFTASLALSILRVPYVLFELVVLYTCSILW